MKPHSNGTAGEQAAEYYFKLNGWKMHRHQPASRVVYLKGKPTVIYERSSGIADYTGYEIVNVRGMDVPVYRACEVKEATDESMPCSRLGKQQRAWMGALSYASAFVGILWMDTMRFEVFKYKPKGSYKKVKYSDY